MNWVRGNCFKVAIIIFLFVFTITIRDYLKDRNEIEAEIGFFNCLEKDAKLNIGWACINIKDYKLREDNIF